MLLEYVFAEKYKTYVGGPGGKNYNTHYAMVWQMLSRYSPVYDVHIQECGAGRSRLITEAAQMLNVDTFGITKISKTHHMDAYKDVDDLIADKTSFDRIHKPGAFGVINADDEVLKSYPFQSKIITYGITNDKADYIGTNIVQNGDMLEFDIEHEGHKSHFAINIVGKHNVSNALMVYVIAKQYGLSDDQIRAGFLKYKSMGIRQNVREVAGRIFYIDCFNVCSDSIKSCLATLKEINTDGNGKRIAVLGGENALGDMSDTINYKTGTEITDEGIDRFIFLGPREPASRSALNYYGNGRALYEGAKKAVPEEKLTFVDDLKVLSRILSDETNIGDVVLLKGIFRLPMFAALDMAFGTNYIVYNVNFAGEKEKDEHCFGNYYKEIDGVNLIKPLEKELYIPDDINGKPVVRIGKNVFKNNSNIEKVVIGLNCKTIGEGCFENCVNIRQVDIPISLVNIEPKAFSGCSGISVLNLSSVKHIGALALQNCTELRKIYLSEQCGTIEKDAFLNCKKIVICAPKNSYAYLYAEKNGLKNQPI